MIDRIGFGGLNDTLLRSIENNRSKTSVSLAKIASGNRLSSAGEDPASSALANQIQSEVTVLSQAVRNVDAGVNFVNTAEGGLSTIADLIARGRELSMQASNGTLNDTQRQTLNNEFTAVRSEIDRITNSSEFNGQPLLNGNLGAKSPNQVNVQAGSGSGPENQINLNVIENTGTKALGIDTANISTAEGARQAFSALDSAANKINETRGQVGALTNRLAVSSNVLGNSIVNLSSAQNELSGTDIASEITKLQQSFNQTQVSIRALSIQNQQTAQSTGRLLDIRG
jgi:flagellin